MHAIIRRYTIKGGAVDRKTMDDLKRQTEDKFMPTLQDLRGFHGYYLMNVNDKEIVSIGVFEDQSALAESTRRAADFVKTLPIQLNNPEIIQGELLVSRETPVGAR